MVCILGQKDRPLWGHRDQYHTGDISIRYIFNVLRSRKFLKNTFAVAMNGMDVVNNYNVTVDQESAIVGKYVFG